MSSAVNHRAATTRHAEEIGDALVGGVVEIRHPKNRIRPLGHCGGEVDEVVRVTLDLEGWVRDRPSVPRDDDEVVVLLERMGLGPLLELDDDVCRFAILALPPARRRLACSSVAAGTR
jgi:hypothetical protein